MRRFFLSVLILCLAPVAPAASGDVAEWPRPAPALPANLTPEEVARATEIVDGDTLVLEDGRQVRLVGIQAPKLPLGRSGFEPWPLADEAKAALAELALGRELRLAYGGRKTDRHGRALAHLETADGLWVQGALLGAGLARVYTFADNRAAAVRGRIYLNYGADWRRDFTVTLDRDTVQRFKAEGIDPLAYEARRLRVRGWVKSFNGPMIEVTHPEQIEVLPE